MEVPAEDFAAVGEAARQVTMMSGLRLRRRGCARDLFNRDS